MSITTSSLPARLDGRIAIVTGAAQGLGLAISAAMAQAGARVVLVDIDPKVSRAADDCAADGATVQALQADVRYEDEWTRMFASAESGYGPVDILVNNAALTSFASIWDISAPEWDDMMAVNLRGCFFGCRTAGRQMRQHGSGRIINMTSLAGQQASATTAAHYAASKAGILALTRSFAAELAPYAITVNALAPAMIDSPLLNALDAKHKKSLQENIPLGRFGTTDELAATAVFLASDTAGYITGTTLDINGGCLMR